MRQHLLPHQATGGHHLAHLVDAGAQPHARRQRAQVQRTCRHGQQRQRQGAEQGHAGDGRGRRLLDVQVLVGCSPRGRARRRAPARRAQLGTVDDGGHRGHRGGTADGGAGGHEDAPHGWHPHGPADGDGAGEGDEDGRQDHGDGPQPQVQHDGQGELEAQQYDARAQDRLAGEAQTGVRGGRDQAEVAQGDAEQHRDEQGGNDGNGLGDGEGHRRREDGDGQAGEKTSHVSDVTPLFAGSRVQKSQSSSSVASALPMT